MSPVSNFRQPAEKFLMMEQGYADDDIWIDGNVNITLATEVQPWSMPLQKMVFRHPGIRANVLFVDGHVDALSAREMYVADQPWSAQASGFGRQRLSFNGESRAGR